MAVDRKAWDVVDRFERALEDYTGSPYAITTDSCTNALFLSLRYRKISRESKVELGGLAPIGRPKARLPARTYVGVVQSVRNAGYEPDLTSEVWKGEYVIDPLSIIDAARTFTSGMYKPGNFMCLSFQASKILPIGRGGAILTDDPAAAVWLRHAKFDGRGETMSVWGQQVFQEGWHMYMTPEQAARGLWLLSTLPEKNLPQDAVYPDLREKHWA